MESFWITSEQNPTHCLCDTEQVLNIAEILSFVTGRRVQSLKKTQSARGTQNLGTEGVILIIQGSLIFRKGLARSFKCQLCVYATTPLFEPLAT